MHKRGFNVLDIQSGVFIKKLAEFFKDKNIIRTPTKWGSIVKCSHANELAPLDSDWFYNKAAAVARRIYINKTNSLGIRTLRALFGKKKRGSVKAPKFALAGGKILREIIKQFKNSKYVANKFTIKDGENHTVGLHLTNLGITEMDKVASKIIKSMN